jgi:hypothetical protein
VSWKHRSRDEAAFVARPRVSRVALYTALGGGWRER